MAINEMHLYVIWCFFFSKIDHEYNSTLILFLIFTNLSRCSDSKKIESTYKFKITTCLYAPCRTLLFSHCESAEEGTRNVVAECLGKLTLIDPDRLLPLLKVSETVG